MSFRATLLTLYPEMFPGPLGVSLAGRALAEGKWSCDPIQMRGDRSPAVTPDQQGFDQFLVGQRGVVLAIASGVVPEGVALDEGNAEVLHGEVVIGDWGFVIRDSRDW